MPEQPKKKIKPYIILCESEISRLEDSVTRLMVQGYRPHGSINIQEERGDLYFYQPMLLTARPAAAKAK